MTIYVKQKCDLLIHFIRSGAKSSWRGTITKASSKLTDQQCFILRFFSDAAVGATFQSAKQDEIKVRNYSLIMHFHSQLIKEVITSTKSGKFLTDFSRHFQLITT